MREIHLNIDRITVEGLSAAEQRSFTRALEAELRALAAAGRLDAAAGGEDRAIRNLHAGELRPGTTANRAAAQVAGSIRQALPGRVGPGAGSRGGEARRHG
ncbi:MAG TPA: hypothetical protein VMU71_01320 [Terracidiphilus sp.]|nr:hypothetical protein [Terracidiphilus sp.]